MWVLLVMPRFAVICLTALMAVLTYPFGRDAVPYDPSCCRSDGSRPCRRVEQSLMGLVYAHNNDCCTCLGLAVRCQSCAILQACIALMWPRGQQQMPQEVLPHLANSLLCSPLAAWEAHSLPGAGRDSIAQALG